nr:unnamed protein product [Callosobruchus chinensis]
MKLFIGLWCTKNSDKKRKKPVQLTTKSAESSGISERVIMGKIRETIKNWNFIKLSMAETHQETIWRKEASRNMNTKMKLQQ